MSDPNSTVSLDSQKGDGDAEEILDILDVEEFAKENEHNRRKPRAHFYVIRIDREKKKVSVPSLMGKEILALVNKTPSTHKLFQKFRGGEAKPVDPDERVDFTSPGVERFQTIPLDPTEG